MRCVMQQWLVEQTSSTIFQKYSCLHIPRKLCLRCLSERLHNNLQQMKKDWEFKSFAALILIVSFLVYLRIFVYAVAIESDKFSEFKHSDLQAINEVKVTYQGQGHTSRSRSNQGHHQIEVIFKERYSYAGGLHLNQIYAFLFHKILLLHRLDQAKFW